MPCWQTNTLVYEMIQVRPELFDKAMTTMEKEIGKLGISFGFCFEDGTLNIRTGLGDYKLNTKTGQASYDQRIKFIHDLVKRHYSMAAVQSMANKSQVFRTFKMNKINDRKIVLTRR